MQYKASTAMIIFSQILFASTVFIGIFFMFNLFETVEGFTFQEIALCFAIMSMAFSAAETFGRGFDMFPRMLGNGQFDRVMVRPRGVIFQVLAMQTDITRTGKLIQSIFVLAYAIPISGIIWTWDKIAVLILMITCGTVVFFGLFLVFAAISFFTTQGLEFMNILTDGGRDHGRYPFSIYGEGVLKFLTYVVPLALFQYYPLLYLIGREDNVLYAITPIISLLFLLPCYGMFRLGLRKYKSTGS